MLLAVAHQAVQTRVCHAARILTGRALITKRGGKWLRVEMR